VPRWTRIRRDREPFPHSTGRIIRVGAWRSCARDTGGPAAATQASRRGHTGSVDLMQSPVAGKWKAPGSAAGGRRAGPPAEGRRAGPPAEGRRAGPPAPCHEFFGVRSVLVRWCRVLRLWTCLGSTPDRTAAPGAQLSLTTDCSTPIAVGEPHELTSSAPRNGSTQARVPHQRTRSAPTPLGTRSRQHGPAPTKAFCPNAP
jgi:hypothetical protein